MTARPRIVAYLKPGCPWTAGVRALLAEYGLEYEHRDVSADAEHYAEMVRKSGQHRAPCVEIDGHLLVDVGADEVEAYLLQQGIVKPRRR